MVEIGSDWFSRVNEDRQWIGAGWVLDGHWMGIGWALDGHWIGRVNKDWLIGKRFGLDGLSGLGLAKNRWDLW